MLGPVLYLEMLLGGRRGKQYIIRWIYASWLILQFLFLYLFTYLAVRTRYNYAAGYYQADTSASGEFASSFIHMLLVQEWIVVALATPAFVAGAITDDKSRGTLQHMLTAHLTAGEIVLGKLLGRLAQVAVLLIVDLPLLCFIGVFGGVHPTLLLAILVGIAAPLFGIGAASVLASVWCRTTRDAVIFLYAIGGVFWIAIVALSAFLPGMIAASSGGLHGFLVLLHKLVTSLHPVDVLRPGLETGNMAEVGHRLLRAFTVWGTFGLACLGLATWRLRPAYIRQLESTGKKNNAGAGVIVRATVDEEPIRWKERTIDGIAPLAPLRRIPRAAGIVIVVLLSLLVCTVQLWLCLTPTGPIRSWRDLPGLLQTVNPTLAGNAFLIQGIAVMLVASLIVGIRASGAISSEREKQTWEALLLTPLQTRELVRGKLGGIFSASVPYLVAYAVIALPFSGLGGFLSFIWTALWLGVTALAIYYIGAAGIWCSTRNSTSWRSLLATLGFGYVGGFIIFAVTSPATFIIAAIIYIFLELADRMYGTVFARAVGGFGPFFIAFFIATCLALALIFFIASRLFLSSAEKRISDRERIRHWKDEPFRRPIRHHAAPPAPYRY